MKVFILFTTILNALHYVLSVLLTPVDRPTPSMLSKTNPAEMWMQLPFLFFIPAFFLTYYHFSWTILISIPLSLSQNLWGCRLSSLSVRAFRFLYLRSTPCFSSSSKILSASTPALALPHSFNPSSSSSAAVKEVCFTGVYYRSTSHRTRQSFCSAARSFRTVGVQQQGCQSSIVKEVAMTP